MVFGGEVGGGWLRLVLFGARVRDTVHRATYKRRLLGF